MSTSFELKVNTPSIGKQHSLSPFAHRVGLRFVLDGWKLFPVQQPMLQQATSQDTLVSLTLISFVSSQLVLPFCFQNVGLRGGAFVPSSSSVFRSVEKLIMEVIHLILFTLGFFVFYLLFLLYDCCCRLVGKLLDKFDSFSFFCSYESFDRNENESSRK